MFGWLSVILLVTFIRGYITYYWYRPDFTLKKTRLFEYISLVLSSLAGFLWGVTVLAMNFSQYPEASVFLNIIVFGLTAGSVGIGSYWFEYFITYNVSVFFLYILGYLLSMPQPYYLLAMSLILFLMFMLQIALVFHRGNAENIWLIKRNEKLADNLAHKKLEAENLAASRTRFLASASHDLRQPLQALNFFLSAIHPELKSPKGHELFTKIEKCAEGMNELLNSILDLSKLDAQVVTINKAPCCLNTLLTYLKQQYLMQAHAKGLSLVIPKTSYYVNSDAMLLQRILSNLLSNAINYTTNGEVKILITYSKYLQIDIIDTGIGLTKKEQTQIFEEFYQLHNPERDKQKGLGLGLSIVKRLCNLLTIPLTLSSEKSKGSKFTLSLPLCDKNVSLEGDYNFTPQKITKNKQVLIIDDDISIRESMSELLEQWQCHTKAVESADEACSLIVNTTFIPDLIIADYRLRNNKTGVDAINLIKSKLNKPQIPAIIVSGDTEPSRLIEVNQTDYDLLHKPVKPAQLRMLIQQKLL